LDFCPELPHFIPKFPGKKSHYHHFLTFFPIPTRNQSTPTFKCKKTCQRPSTKQLRKKETSRDDEDESAAISVAKNNLPSKKSSNSSKESKIDVASASSVSTDFCNVGGSCYVKLCAIVEQLQDIEW
jgi:hypothetical protein